MAVFSNVDIDNGLKDGSICIEDSNGVTRMNSRDLRLEGDIWEVTGPEYHDIMEIHRRLGARGIDVDYHLPGVPRNHRINHKGEYGVPGKVYVIESPKIITAKGIKTRVVARSTAARNGIHAFSPVNNEWIAVVTYAYSELDRGHIAQALFYEEETKPLKGEEMKNAVSRGELLFSRPHILQFGEGYGYVPTHFAKGTIPYNGGVLKIGESEKNFARGKKPSIFDFRLASMAEEIGTGPSYVLWMTSDEGYIHPNAALINATVPPNQHTLEVLLAPEEVAIIEGSKKPRYACSVRAYALKTPTTMDYSEIGRYHGQTLPLPSKAPASVQ